MAKTIIFLGNLLVSSILLAHAPLISVDDNGDGSLYIEGGFSNGASAEGIECIIVKDRAYNGPEDTFRGKEIIYIGHFNKNNSIEIPKPFTSKYEVYFNGGEGHIIGKKGPKLEETEMENWRKLSENYDYGIWKKQMTSK